MTLRLASDESLDGLEREYITAYVCQVDHAARVTAIHQRTKTKWDAEAKA